MLALYIFALVSMSSHELCLVDLASHVFRFSPSPLAYTFPLDSLIFFKTSTLYQRSLLFNIVCLVGVFVLFCLWFN